MERERQEGKELATPGIEISFCLYPSRYSIAALRGFVISGKRVKHSDSRMRLLAADMTRAFATACRVTSFSVVHSAITKSTRLTLLFSYRYHLRSYLHIRI